MLSSQYDRDVTPKRGTDSLPTHQRAGCPFYLSRTFVPSVRPDASTRSAVEGHSSEKIGVRPAHPERFLNPKRKSCSQITARRAIPLGLRFFNRWASFCRFSARSIRICWQLRGSSPSPGIRCT
jgi:hypothetical protein